MPLPSFTLQSRVSGNTAKQDKIEFLMPLGTFRDVPDNLSIEAIAETLGAPRESTRTSAHADIARLYSCYFKRPTGRPRSGSQTLEVRNRPIEGLARVDRRLGERPLCAGALMLQTGGLGNNQFITANYGANVNPSRFVRYQGCNVVPGSRRSWLAPLFRKASLDSGGEFSLDDSDNWIPDHPAAIWQSFIAEWPARLFDYFNELETAMRGEMERRGQMSSLDGTGTLRFVLSDEPWRLRHVESYWEFRQQLSPEFLAMVESAMASYSAMPYTRQDRERPRGRRRGRVTQNGTVLSMTAAPGVEIVVYAKTNERVRFEVRHKMADLAARSGLPLEASGVAGMVQALQSYSEDAAEVLNTFLAHLERMEAGTPVAWSPPPTDFIFAIVGGSESREVARVILGLLMTQGAVSRAATLNRSLSALAKAHVLERARNAQRGQSMTFVPTPRYQRALNELRRVATDVSLTVETRRRL